MRPHYRHPFRITVSILGSFLLGRRRSLAADAPLLMRGVDRFSVRGSVPAGGGPYLFLINHYSAPGFKAWWLAIALTAAAEREPAPVVRPGLHWSMTSAWIYPDPLRARLLTPVTEWVLARLARLYGFTLMPPMPPRPQDALARAAAVRRILRLARASRPDIALAPEGMDSPDGRLMQPPPGAGRFMAHISSSGYTLVPVGAFEEGDTFVIRFGEPFTLDQAEAVRHPTMHLAGTASAFRDRETGKIVMEKIAELLPPNLHSPVPFPPSLKGRGKGVQG
jgi:1-acyl-sn-glycerol-3-phosphate acyltransferase